MANRPDLSGRSTSTCRSNRPARSKAGSKISGRFVAANRTMPALGSKPQRLAGAGRSHKQDAFWNARSQTAIAPWILQKGHDFLQFELGLVDAGNIRKRYLCILLDIDLGTRFSDRHQSAEPLTTAYATAEKRPQAK